jgi:hypothetical protein
MKLNEQNPNDMMLEQPQTRENNGADDSSERATTRVAPTNNQIWQKFCRGAATMPEGAFYGQEARCALPPSNPKQNPNHGFSRFLVFFLALICFSTQAFAKKIEILQAERLELRNVTTPDGKVEEYVIITGKPAIVRIDKDELEANRIEFNKTRRKLYIVGQGVLRGEKETIAGNDFVVDTSDNSLEGVDVLIATSDIDVVGISVERLPGQLEVKSGYFSPCSRCGKVGDAYGFKAGSLTLFPGDRLIARDVTILVAGEPILYLPIMVVLLSEPSRQPRWVFRIGDFSVGGGGNASTDTTLPNVELDLPFTTGDFGLGFTLLRYYGNRNPAFGLGVDWTLFDLFGGINKSRVFFLVLPPTSGSTLGAPIAYRLESDGSFDINPNAEPEDALPSVKYKFILSRVDEGITRSEDLRGLTGPQRRTEFGAKFNLDTTNYAIELELSSFFLNQDLATPTSSATFPYRNLVPANTLYFPEFRFTAKDSLLPKFGGLAAQSFSLSIGMITAQYNSINRSARFAADPLTGLITAGKLDVKYGVGLTLNPWEGATLTSGFRFEGRYYTTQNPSNTATSEKLKPTGEFERSVDYQFTTRFSQTIFKDLARVELTADYSETSGESPFGFDSVSIREAALRSGLSLNITPVTWLSLTASENLTVTATKAPKLDPAQFGLNFTPSFGNLSFSTSYNLETGILQSWNIGGGLNTPFGITFRFSTGQNINPTSGGTFYRYLPLGIDIAFSGDGGKITASANITHDLNPDGRVQNIGLNFGWRFGDTENPFAFNFGQNLTPPQTVTGNDNKSAFSLLRGSTRFTWRGLSIGLDNTFDFKPWTYLALGQLPPLNVNPSQSSFSSTPASSFTLNITGDAPLSWGLKFDTFLDLENLEFFQPKLTANLDTVQQGSFFDLSLRFTILFPDRNQKDFQLSSLSLQFGWDVLPGFSISGAITYSRDIRSGIFYDTFNLTPLAFTTAFESQDSSKPDVFFSIIFKGTYVFDDDPKSNGIPNFTGTGESYRTFWRPVLVLTYDLCCYTLQFTLDTTPKGGASFTFSFILPFGGKQDALIGDEKGLRFPILPFIQPIK